jgi:hypothetical protein
VSLGAHCSRACAADSGIPGECAIDLSKGRPLGSMVLEDRVNGSSTSALAKLQRVVRIVPGLLLFERLLYSGCSSRKHTTPVWVLGKVDLGSVLAVGSAYDDATISLNASEVFEHTGRYNNLNFSTRSLLIQKERLRSLRSLQRKLSSSAAAAPLSPWGSRKFITVFRVYPCIKASGLGPALVKQQCSPPF